MDKNKTLFIQPRPLVSAQDQIRAQNLTGDSSGESDTDGRFSWHGLDRKTFVELAKESQRRKDPNPIEVKDQQA